MTTVLDAIRVDTGGRALHCTSHGVTIAAVIVDVFKVESMDVTGEVSARSKGLVAPSEP